MTQTTRVKDLFEIPETIRKGDFVEKLSEAVSRPQRTAETFVVTSALQEAFDRALRLVGSALRDGRSQAAYLHGSFGSGKSHFMALLSLLMQGNEHAWRIPELHPLREPHDRVVKGRLLELHFHMVGKQSIEAAVFSGYLAHCKAHHPDAPIAPLFADEELFADAAGLLKEVGDEQFFAKLNEGETDDKGWGELASECRWDRERFDVAAGSTEPLVRAELFDVLTRTWFTSFVGGSQAFVDLDSGLAVMAGHAARLGYEGVVLFLDELILWLASRASKTEWLHNEVQKMVKLVEAQESGREIPIISFIARQRDLAEMVGEEYAGVYNRNLRDSLKWWEGRYDTIVLEDRNLPAIVEKRVLKPKDDTARDTLKQAFDTLRKGAGPAWQTLLGQGDGEAFERLYPFSPALVDALVALSNSLQRERTAIKLLVELLYEHIEDLTLGEVLRVGDLYDVLVSGEDSADGVMRHRFDIAKDIYNSQFLPMIQESNGTTTEERCQRLATHQTSTRSRSRLGCANCPEKSCRTHNRLAKTLILAALVPEVAAFKKLTASRLVQLNHGTLKTPIPGTEASMVAGLLREWDGRIGQLRVGDGTNPPISLQLEGVNIEPIIEQARDADSPGARQRVVRDLLFEAIGIGKGASSKEHKVTWRNTERKGIVKFGNVRLMQKEQLSCPEDLEWQLTVDYPFDEGNYGPNDDIEVVEGILESGAGSWSMVWLPSFFSESTNKLIGDLVALDHILETTDSKRRYVSHLAVENQERALNDLESIQSAKASLIRNAIEQAYGIITPKEGTLDPSRAIDTHLHVLKSGVRLQSEQAATLGDAIEVNVHALMEARYPRHPRFTKKLTVKTLERVLDKFGEIIDVEDKRIPADRDLAQELRGSLEVLGLVRVTETAAHLVEDRMLQEIERQRLQKGIDDPRVDDVRVWIDPTDTMGLQPAAADLVVRAYARWSARTFEDLGRPFALQAGKEIPGEVILVKPDLPSQTEWNDAIRVAGMVAGYTFSGRALHADNLTKFAAEVAQRLTSKSGSCAKLPALLADWGAMLGVPADADRMVTAICADQLLAALSGQKPVEIVHVLSGMELKTSPKAVGQSIASAADLVQVLGDKLIKGTFEPLIRKQTTIAGARELIDELSTAFRQDEINMALSARVRDLAVAGQALQRDSDPPKAADNVLVEERIEVKRDTLEKTLDELASTLRKRIADVDDPKIEVHITVTGRRRS